MSTMPISLSGLTDREAIADTIYRFVTGYDRTDEALLRSALTEDVVVEVRGMTLTGRERVMETFFKPTLGKIDTTHTSSALRIDVAADGKTARLEANMVAMHLPHGQGLQPGFQFFQNGMLYNADVVKDETDGLWKAKKWVSTLLWTQGDRDAVMGPILGAFEKKE